MWNMLQRPRVCHILQWAPPFGHAKTLFHLYALFGLSGTRLFLAELPGIVWSWTTATLHKLTLPHVCPHAGISCEACPCRLSFWFGDSFWDFWFLCFFCFSDFNGAYISPGLKQLPALRPCLITSLFGQFLARAFPRAVEMCLFLRPINIVTLKAFLNHQHYWT